MTREHKVAFATNDGTDMNRHFGRLSGYVVITVRDGLPTGRQLLARPASADRPGGGHDHSALLDPVSDCAVLVAGGMGLPMVGHIEARGIRLILTSLTSIDDALERYLAGTLEHEPARAHATRH
jgi:predicted Fe-Mo cluster-binding NifX family protein